MVRPAISVVVLSALILTLFGAPRALAEAVTVTAGTADAPPEGDVEVVVSTRNSQGLGGLQFHLRYDPSVLEWSDAQMHADAGGGMLDAKVVQPGQVRIALVSQEPIEGDRALVTTQFKATGEAGSRSTIELDAARAWTHEDIVELLVATEAGSVQVAEQAAPVPMTLVAVGVGVLLVVIVLVLVLRRRG